MIVQSGQISAICFPAEWGNPEFKLGQRVVYNSEPAIVTGVHWVGADSRLCKIDDAAEGWWYALTYLSDSHYARVMATEFLHESVIPPIEPSESSELNQFNPVLPTEPLKALA